MALRGVVWWVGVVCGVWLVNKICLFFLEAWSGQVLSMYVKLVFFM